MKITYSTNRNVSPHGLYALAKTQGWERSRTMKRNIVAIKGSIFIASARHNNKLVGIIRLAGDGSYCLHIAEFIVHPKYQRRGIGRKLLEMCLSFARKKKIGIDNNMGEFTLFANIGVEKFYTKFGFMEAPNGMVLANSKRRRQAELEFNKKWINKSRPS